MIELRKDIVPSAEVIKKLQEFQDTIDAESGFAKKTAKAKAMFASKNTKANSTFNEVKKCLTQMCNSTKRCVYCEDSVADEVEHIYPKDLYPEKCFSWENYVYACGPCNGPKNNKFAIFKKSGNTFIEVNPPKGTAPAQPPEGESALINPRTESPLEFAILDLANSFKFYPLPNISARNKKKADYTFNEVLRLNHEEREPLRQARENAYSMYKARLFEYVTKATANAPVARLNKLKDNILKENHPTVWKEMQRYYQLNLLNGIDSELKQLFDKAPEALTW